MADVQMRKIVPPPLGFRRFEGGSGIVAATGAFAMKTAHTIRRASFLLILLAVLALHTVSIPAQDRSGSDPAFAPDSIQAEITYLASDALRGRGSGEPGNEMAARFIAQAFARDGLQPLGTRRQRDPNAPMDGSGFFQPFRFLAGRAVGQDNMLEAAFPVPRSGALKR